MEYKEIKAFNVDDFLQKIKIAHHVYGHDTVSMIYPLDKQKVIFNYAENKKAIDYLMNKIEEGNSVVLENYIASNLLMNIVTNNPVVVYDYFNGLDIKINRCEQSINKDLYVDFSVGAKLIFEKDLI